MNDTIENMLSQIEKVDQEIFDLEQTIEQPLFLLNQKKEVAKMALDLEVAKIAAESLKHKKYGCGTHNIETQAYKIKTTVSKKVTWDDALLQNGCKVIDEANRDPRDCIKHQLSVSETNYNGFTDDIKNLMEPARTVEPSKPTIKVVRK